MVGTVETIADAAAELLRLHMIFKETAVVVDFSPEYIQQRLEGERGVTWDVIPRTSAFGRPTPIFDTATRKGKEILLGAYLHGGLRYRYALVEGSMPAFLGTDQISAVTIHRARCGFDPGAKYVIVGEQILKAGIDIGDSMVTVDDSGRLAWSAPSRQLNDQLNAMSGLDFDLRRVIADLRAYEPR